MTEPAQAHGYSALTPSAAYEHIKEAMVGYIEASYRISHPAVVQERGDLLRRVGTLAQVPFVESTPAFPTSRLLSKLEGSHPGIVPPGLSELVSFGVPVDSRELFVHQEEALLATFGESPNLLVASGTGSGKTEAFLLPILAGLLREGSLWTPPSGPALPGEWHQQSGAWLHSRRHETRPAALRAIVLYPMNALVSDQLGRLRRILARDGSPEWQLAHLNQNFLRFGMYTGLSQPAGPPSIDWRRTRFAGYMQQVAQEWCDLPDELRAGGIWPRPDGPEMLCRWDVQHAPPDILAQLPQVSKSDEYSTSQTIIIDGR